MKNLLFKTHVFSIDEHDGISCTSFERSFIQALEKMIQKKGMYVIASRQYEYGLSARKLVLSTSPKTIVFGKAYTYEKAIKAFNGDWLEYVCKKHADEGANLFVSNFKLSRIMVVPEDAIVLSEIALDKFLTGMRTPRPDKKIIFTDYAFELGNGMEFSAVPRNECLQQQIGKLIGDETINFIKINTVNFYEDGAVGSGKILPHYLFSKDVLMSRDQAIRHFAENRLMMKFLKQYVEDVYIYCKENNSLQRVPERATFISALTLKKWSTGMK